MKTFRISNISTLLSFLICFGVDAKPFNVDTDVPDYVGRRLKNRLGLPFVGFVDKKRLKKVDRRNNESSVFQKLTDFLVFETFFFFVTDDLAK
jgi:hypothetical protein